MRAYTSEALEKGFMKKAIEKKEQELVGKILQGDEGAVEEMYKKYFPKIADYVFGKIDNPFDAQEIIQDIFISAIDCLPAFNFKSSLFTWLYAIGKHEVVDYYRKKRIKAILFSRVPILETLASKALGPEEELIEKEIKVQIRLVLAQLSEGYRKILRLKYVQGFSVVEVAQILGISPKAAESRLSRARLAFREVWATENFQFPISNFQTNLNVQNSKDQKENTLQFPS